MCFGEVGWVGGVVYNGVYVEFFCGDFEVVVVGIY